MSDEKRSSKTARSPKESFQERFAGSEELLRAFRDALDASNIVSMTDPNGTITYANDEFCRISGYSREELIGNNHRIIRHPDMPAEVFADLWQTITAGKVWRGLVKNRKKNGLHYWVKTVIMPVLDGEGKITDYISVRTDVTDLEEAKEELAKSLAKLEELDRRKSDFVNVASHELRTPLTVIRGYAEMMEDTAGGKSDPEVREYAGEILKSATSLIRLVGDMLDLSKMESGSETFLSEECDLADTVRSIVKEMAPFARERRVELAVMGGSVPVPIHTDPGKIRRAILNIVSNAVKFTPAGGSVTCSTFESAKGWGVSVQDTGIGIPKSDLDTIFEKFHQVENSLKRETAGSGLGLPIAKEIVERSGGKILVSSEP